MKKSLCYSAITLAVTFVIGELLLFLFPEGNAIGSSIWFICHGQSCRGGLEECGWRWYLQPKLDIKSYILKMFLISIVWFLWHIPIYRLPWITAGSSNYLIFYLMILGNTFMFGAIKEYSKGVLPCVIAHILIDSLAAAMLVGSNIIKIGILVGFEVIISIFCVIVRKENNSKIRRRTLDICKTL